MSHTVLPQFQTCFTLNAPSCTFMLCLKPWLTYDHQENQHANLESAVLLSLTPQEKLRLNQFLNTYGKLKITKVTEVVPREQGQLPTLAIG